MPQRAYKFRFYPNATQRVALHRMFGVRRWAWNTCLAWRKDLYEALGESGSGTDFSRELTFLKTLAPYAWLRETPATVAIQALRDLDRAYADFFRRVKAGETPGYPKFRSRHDAWQSCRVQLDQRTVAGRYRAGELLDLPGLGPCKLRWSRRPLGIPKMVTVSRDPAGRYFVSMAVEEAIDPLPPAVGAVGVDLGLHHLATLSDGTKVENPRHLAGQLERLKRLQQRKARQCRGSRRHAATQQRIARVHARITDMRREALHRFTTRLVIENQVVSLEDLAVRGMGASARGTRANPGRRVKQKAGLNRSLRDAAFGEIRRQLAYKAAWYGRTLVTVDRFYPSSKTCSTCGHRLEALPLDQRSWVCPVCGAHHDRDVNAALNIERQGLAQLIHPEDTGGVRASGGEGACPMPVSARIVRSPNACLEQA